MMKNPVNLIFTRESDSNCPTRDLSGHIRVLIVPLKLRVGQLVWIT